MSKKSICAILLGFSVLLGSFTLSGCDEVPQTSTPDSNTYVVSPEPDSYLPQEEFEWEHELLEHETFENVGRTSANVRAYFVDDERHQHHYDVFLYDISQVEQYHEFVTPEGLARMVFTTESTVRDFRFLEIQFNHNFFNENADENERHYNVESVLYTLDELTPEIPLVVTGVNLGSTAVAANGFSFVDEDGETRYFLIQVSGKTGFLAIGEF